MPTSTVYPIASPQEDWTPSAAVDHYTLVDDAPWPADEANYISVAGFSAGKVEKLVLGQCDSSIDRIQSVSGRVRVKGTAAVNSPALKIELTVNGAAVVTQFGGCDTGGAWATINFVVTGLNMLRDTYNNGTPTIVLTPLNGSIVGLPDFTEE